MYTICPCHNVVFLFVPRSTLLLFNWKYVYINLCHIHVSVAFSFFSFTSFWIVCFYVVFVLSVFNASVLLIHYRQPALINKLALHTLWPNSLLLPATPQSGRFDVRNAARYLHGIVPVSVWLQRRGRWAMSCFALPCFVSKLLVLCTCDKFNQVWSSRRCPFVV